MDQEQKVALRRHAVALVQEMPSDAFYFENKPEGYDGFVDLEKVRWKDEKLEWTNNEVNPSSRDMSTYGPSYSVEGHITISTQRVTARATRWQPADTEVVPWNVEVMIRCWPEAESGLGVAEVAARVG